MGQPSFHKNAPAETVDLDLPKFLQGLEITSIQSIFSSLKRDRLKF